MKKRRVVITGLGVVAPNGIGKDKFWEAIKEGKSGIDKITSFDTRRYPVKVAGEVKDFHPEKIMDPKTLSRTTRFARFAFYAAKEAIEDAGFNKANYNSERVGVAIGTNLGGLDYAFDQHKILLKKGIANIDSFVTALVVPYAASRVISESFKAQGPCKTFCSSCPASTDAIGYSLDCIRKGETDVMITGGAEAPIHPSLFAGFCLSRILSLRNDLPISIPSPFDARRDGTVLSEGSAILILEDLGHALERKAKIYAEIAGYASTCDAYHIVNPDPAGTQGIRAISLALEDAGIKPNEVDYINAHGTSTPKNDKVETDIIKKVFGDYAYKIPVSSTKSMTGHLLGAGGALEALISVLAIRDDIVPPTINYQIPDPECDLDYVPNKAKKQEIKVAVSNSFGLGGTNSVLVFRKYYIE